MRDQKPTLEYATPLNRLRFLEKLNPKAICRSVLCKSIISGLTAAVIWRLLFLLRLNDNWHAEWGAFVWWELAAMIGGAVTDWQPLDG